MKDLNHVLSRMGRLTRLELTGNPLCQKSKYRDRVITMGASIGTTYMPASYIHTSVKVYTYNCTLISYNDGSIRIFSWRIKYAISYHEFIIVV